MIAPNMASDYGHGMTNFALQPEPPLPPPHRVPNAPLDLKFSLMTPDQIRRFVREEAIAGRYEYKCLYEAAVRALGPESPEALANIANCASERSVCDKIGWRRVWTGSERKADGCGFCIETHAWVDVAVADAVVRFPVTGWLEDTPTMDEIIEAHRAAMPAIVQTIKDREEAVAKAKAEAEQAKAAPAETHAAA